MHDSDFLLTCRESSSLPFPAFASSTALKTLSRSGFISTWETLDILPVRIHQDQGKDEKIVDEDSRAQVMGDIAED